MPSVEQKKIKITQTGDPILRKRTKEIPIPDIVSDKIQGVIAEMSRALYASENGIGIAAPQIGVSLSVFLVSEEAIAYGKGSAGVEKKKTDWRHRVFINPKLIKRSAKKELMTEGCLSVDGVFGKVKRSKQVTVGAYDETGKKFRVGASGLFAQVLQHELDHLNGVLFVDSARDLEKIESAADDTK